MNTQAAFTDFSEPEPSGVVTDPCLGTLIDHRYRLTRRLGSGGVGVVYEAMHEITGREVAVKLVSPSAAHTDDMLERFAREARTASTITHPNVVAVLDAGVLEDRTPFLVMELLRGEVLAELAHREGALSPVRAAQIIGEAADALGALHAAGIVHRDVKTENLFIEADGRVKLLDFGLAVFRDRSTADKLTREGVISGTPHYMPPEVFEGGTPDVAWDVYALATVAFELLTGELPFDHANPLKMLVEKRDRVAPTLMLCSGLPFSAALEQVVAEALARRPEDRPATPMAFAERLSRAASQTHDSMPLPIALPMAMPARAPNVLESRPTEAEFPVPSLAYRPRTLVLAGAALTACTLVVGIAWSAFTHGERIAAPLAIAAPQASEAQIRDARVATTIEAVAPVSAVAAPVALAPALIAVEPARTAASARPRAARVRTAADLDVTDAARADADASLRLTREGNAALMRGMLPDAITLLRQATIAAPHNAAAWRSLGLANERSDLRLEARRAYERYLAIAPNAADTAEVRRRIAGL